MTGRRWEAAARRETAVAATDGGDGRRWRRTASRQWQAGGGEVDCQESCTGSFARNVLHGILHWILHWILHGVGGGWTVNRHRRGAPHVGKSSRFSLDVITGKLKLLRAPKQKG